MTSRTISARHLPPLFIGTAFVFGGAIPFFNARAAIEYFGLPERIATSEPAHTVMAVYGSRTMILGLAILSFYRQGKLAAVDTLMACIGALGAFDGYICWKEGIPATGVFRAISSFLVGGWGWFGLTQSQ